MFLSSLIRKNSLLGKYCKICIAFKTKYIQLQTFMKVIFFINLSSMNDLKLTYILNKCIQCDAVPKCI